MWLGSDVGSHRGGLGSIGLSSGAMSALSEYSGTRGGRRLRRDAFAKIAFATCRLDLAKYQGYRSMKYGIKIT